MSGCSFRDRPEPAVPLGKVDERQAGVELGPQELRRSGTGRGMGGQQLVDLAATSVFVARARRQLRQRSCDPS